MRKKLLKLTNQNPVSSPHEPGFDWSIRVGRRTRWRVLLLRFVAVTLFSTGVIRFGRAFIAGFSYPPQGDFAATWPTYWAWRINPEFILQNEIGLQWDASRSRELWSYGPVLHFIGYPLLYLKSFQTAFNIWLIATALWLIGSMAIWYKILIIHRRKHFVAHFMLFASIWLNFMPTTEVLTLRVIEGGELFALSLAFLFLSRDQSYRSGFFFGVATMTKFLPAIFLPLLVVKRRWRTLISAVVTIGVLAIVAQVTLGWENSMLVRLPPVGMANSYIDNQAINGWIARFFTHQGPSDVASGIPAVYAPQTAQLVSRVIIFSILSSYAILFYVRRRSMDVYLAAAILSVIMIAVIQQNHPHYLIFLLVPYSICFAEVLNWGEHSRPQRIGWAAVVALSYALTGILFPVSLVNKFINGFIAMWEFYSVPVYGYLILLGALTYRLLQKSAVTSRETIPASTEIAVA